MLGLGVGDQPSQDQPTRKIPKVPNGQSSPGSSGLRCFSIAQVPAFFQPIDIESEILYPPTNPLHYGQLETVPTNV